jgi:hypothetical protein
LEYTDSGEDIGSFDADLTFTGGSAWSQIAYAKSGYTFGTFVSKEGIVPSGYIAHIDGDLFVTSTPVRATTWGAIKGLYR